MWRSRTSSGFCEWVCVTQLHTATHSYTQHSYTQLHTATHSTATHSYTQLHTAQLHTATHSTATHSGSLGQTVCLGPVVRSWAWMCWVEEHVELFLSHTHTHTHTHTLTYTHTHTHTHIHTHTHTHTLPRGSPHTLSWHRVVRRSMSPDLWRVCSAVFTDRSPRWSIGSAASAASVNNHFLLPEGSLPVGTRRRRGISIGCVQACKCFFLQFLIFWGVSCSSN